MALVNVTLMMLRWPVGLLLLGLLVPALALTGARLLEPGSGIWIRAIAYTPYAAVLYALALLLLLLVRLTGRGAWRGTVRTLGVLALLGLAVHLLWVSGLYVGSATAAAGGTDRFTVLTADLRHGHADAAQVVRLAASRDVNVVVLEEVTRHALEALHGAGLDRAYRYSAGHPVAGAAGTMVFSDQRISTVRRLDTKLASYAVTIRLAGGPLRLLAVHPRPAHGSGHGWTHDQRAVVQAAAGLGDKPAVLAGDFNATLDHQPLRELGGRGYTDAVVQAKSGWQPTWPSTGQVDLFGAPVPPLLQVDHVLVNGAVRALETTAVTLPGTDHRAVVARLEM
jgi:endonuclease/exonuclease/phosphatase (EEP) superfamily protein YafD